jgi:hypothetical protein
MDVETKRAHSIPFPSQKTTATWYYCITLARFPFIAYIVSVAAENKADITKQMARPTSHCTVIHSSLHSDKLMNIIIHFFLTKVLFVNFTEALFRATNLLLYKHFLRQEQIPV